MKVAIIGGGNMGGAIASSLMKEGSFSVMVYERTESKAERLTKETGVTLLSSVESASAADIVIIALKPQNLPSFYERLRETGDKLFISIAAGVSLKTLKNSLKSDRVVRFMPNIGAKAGQSVTAVSFDESLEKKDKDLALKIASSFGDAFEIDESLLSTFIGISGSAIAFMFDFMHHIAMEGVRNGLPYSQALSIVSGTMMSAAKLQKMTQKGAIELETMVCSPRGTTIEGVKVLTEEGFATVVQDAVEAVIQRSEEMMEESNND